MILFSDSTNCILSWSIDSYVMMDSFIAPVSIFWLFFIALVLARVSTMYYAHKNEVNPISTSQRVDNTNPAW